MPDYETLLVNVDNKVAHIQINRPDKANSMNQTFWQEIGAALMWADQSTEVRVIVLSGVGKHFCAGIDLDMLANICATDQACAGRRAETLRHNILELQTQLNAIEKCRKPVIAAIHGACIGGGVDMIAACDLRYCTDSASFSVKEIDVGMVADVGSLQRLPHLIGDGVTRELAYTGRTINGEEAKNIRLVNQSFPNKDDMLASVMATANEIASKSPLSIRGIKEISLFARDHSVAEGLNYVATWNAGMLISDDLKETLAAKQQGRNPEFKD